MTAAVAMGLLGYFFSNRSVFFFVVGLAIPTMLVMRLISSDEIDCEIARGAQAGVGIGAALSQTIAGASCISSCRKHAKSKMGPAP